MSPKADHHLEQVITGIRGLDMVAHGHRHRLPGRQQHVLTNTT